MKLEYDNTDITGKEIIEILKRRFPGCNVSGSNYEVIIKISLLVGTKIGISRSNGKTILNFSDKGISFVIYLLFTGLIFGLILEAIVKGDFTNQVYLTLKKDLSKRTVNPAVAAALPTQGLTMLSQPTPLQSVMENVNAPSQKMFYNPLSFRGRISRGEYVLSFIAIYAVWLLISKVFYGSIFLLLTLVPLYWFLWAQGAKRCHDRGNSGWYQIIPLYVLWMIFGKGEDSPNKYGFPPEGFTGQADKYLLDEIDSPQTIADKRRKSFIGFGIVCGIILLIALFLYINEQRRHAEYERYENERKAEETSEYESMLSSCRSFLNSDTESDIMKADSVLKKIEDKETGYYASYIDYRTDSKSLRADVDAKLSAIKEAKAKENGFSTTIGNFSIKFPKKPIYQLDDNGWHQWNYDNGKNVYIAQYYNSPVILNATSEYNDMRNSFSQIGCTLVDEQSYTIDGHYAKIYKTKHAASNAYMTFCVSITDSYTCYMLLVRDNYSGSGFSKTATDFFDSFVILDN